LDYWCDLSFSEYENAWGNKVVTASGEEVDWYVCNTTRETSGNMNCLYDNINLDYVCSNATIEYPDVDAIC